MLQLMQIVIHTVEPLSKASRWNVTSSPVSFSKRLERKHVFIIFLLSFRVIGFPDPGDTR